MDSDFWVHLIALIVGIVIILIITRKYRKFSLVETAGMIILYAALVLLFTSPIINLVKKFIE
ncbi:MAG TPA: hypothetical protein PKW17_08790, partial [Smithellaceae bacterium]|nr:hypothetical protein [Smithellaceae bacterium]